MVKSMLQRLEESVVAKTRALPTTTFSSLGALNVHAKGISIDLREMEAQIAALKQDALLKNDADILQRASEWSAKYSQLVSESHAAILEAKGRVHRRHQLGSLASFSSSKRTSLDKKLDEDVVEHFGRVGRSLGDAVDRSATANVRLAEGTQTLRRVGQRYQGFGDDVLASSQRLIRRYAQKEERDWRFFRLSLYIFALVLVFVVYMRLPLLKSTVLPILWSFMLRTYRAVWRRQLADGVNERPEL